MSSRRQSIGVLGDRNLRPSSSLKVVASSYKAKNIPRRLPAALPSREEAKERRGEERKGESFTTSATEGEEWAELHGADVDDVNPAE